MDHNSVHVIALFDTDGNIRPIYIKAEGYDAIKIEHVLSSKDAPFCGTGRVLEFVCTYIKNNTRKKFRLHYSIRDHIWSIPDWNNY